MMFTHKFNRVSYSIGRENPSGPNTKSASLKKKSA